MPIDVYRILLNSESRTSGSRDNANYEVRIPNRRSSYLKYELYVDDFTINLGATTIDSILVNLNNSLQYNSWNSTTEGQNPTIAIVFPQSVTSGRTDNLICSYQNATAPYVIQALPSNMNVLMTDIDNATLDLDTNSNFWCLNLRIHAHYDYDYDKE